MRVLDFFSGIGGFRLGLERAGHEVVGACELANAPRLVYADRWGHEPAWKDIRHVEAKELPEADLWTAGFPCQDVSPAGPKTGLDGERSGLVFDLLRLAAAARPTWLLLENSDGLLVRGRGFGRLLRELVALGYVGAHRVLDAHAFGVPQHRRRVYLLARRAGARGPCPGELLLHEPRGQRRDHESGETGAGVARALTVSAGGRRDLDTEPFVYGVDWLANTLTASAARSRTSAGNQSVVYGFNGWTGCTGDLPQEEACPELGAGRRAAVLFSNGSTAKHAGRMTDAATTLLAQGNRPNVGNGGTVVFDLAQVTSGENRSRCEDGAPAPTVNATSRLHVASQGQRGPYVRMLTVLECERVMGYPDGWTVAAGKDTPRRRCLGNAVVPQVIEWIGGRLALA